MLNANALPTKPQYHRGPLTATPPWGRWTDTIQRLAQHLAAKTDWAVGWRWCLLMRVWPLFASLVAVKYEMLLSENTIFWVYTASDASEDYGVNELLGDISDLINRAPAPGGADEYIVQVERLTAVPDEPADMPLEWVENTLRRRRRVAARSVSGDRWYDWKHGQGQEELREIMTAMMPTPELPVVLIRVVVTGQMVSRRLKLLKGRGA